MTDHRVVCTEQTDWNSQGHGRIIAIGTGDDVDQAGRRWTVAETYAALDAGHTFHVISPTTRKKSWVGKYTVNGIPTLRSYADKVWDNNLDSLRGCRFAA